MQHQFYNAETHIWTAPPNKSIWNPEASIGDLIFYGLSKNGSKVAQIFADDESQQTFDEIKEKSIRVAVNLKKCGIKQGDLIAVAGRNNKDIAAVLFGCLFIGAPVNTLDPSFEKGDLAHMFNITKPKLVVCEKSNLASVECALSDTKLPGSKVLVFGESVTSTLLQPIEIDYDNFMPAYIPNCTKKTAMILCSSGTTGFSKGVCISHAQITGQMMDVWKVTDTDINLAFSSLYWVTGVIFLLCSTVAGAKRIITEKPFSSDLLIGLIEKYRISHMFGPPSHLAAMLESPKLKDADLRSLQLCITGGSYVAEELREGFEKQLPNAIVRTCYGMTEMGIVSTCLPTHKALSVGQLKVRVAVKVVDQDGNLLGPSQKGELIIKAPYQFLGYWGDLQQTKEAIDNNGWFHSGDLGYFDEDAFLFIVGRSKEIIKYRGYQISPIELETFLQKETGIMQVCVIGIEDIKHGTDLPAAVLLQSAESSFTAEDIQRISDEKLPDYKRFRGGVYFLDKFPMTPSGKIKKRIVKEQIEKVYKLTQQK